MNLWVAGDVCLAGEPEHTLPALTDSIWNGLLPNRRPTDVLIANVENALTNLGTPRPFKWANLRAAPESVRLLRGLDVAVLSNNHVSDFGEVGVDQTLETLALERIAAVGYGANLGEAACPLIVKRDGARLAVVAQCCPTTNGENYATHTTAGVPTLSESCCAIRFQRLERRRTPSSSISIGAVRTFTMRFLSKCDSVASLSDSGRMP